MIYVLTYKLGKSASQSDNHAHSPTVPTGEVAKSLNTNLHSQLQYTKADPLQGYYIRNPLFHKWLSQNMFSSNSNPTGLGDYSINVLCLCWKAQRLIHILYLCWKPLHHSIIYLHVEKLYYRDWLKLSCVALVLSQHLNTTFFIKIAFNKFSTQALCKWGLGHRVQVTEEFSIQVVSVWL